MRRQGSCGAATTSAALRLAGLLCLACGQTPTSTPPARPHLLLVSIDTLRADHLGCYGYARATSPALDALARESIRFSDASAPTPWTLPSHAAMLTGMHPHELGIDTSARNLPVELPTVAELLAAGGYQTAAFVDSDPAGFVGASRGFGRGFERFQHAPHRDGLAQRFDMAATVDAAVQFLDGRDRGRPFFLFLHTKSVHAEPNDAGCLEPRCLPYDKPEPYRSRFLAAEEAPFVWGRPEAEHGQTYLWDLNARILRGELDPRAYPRERLRALEAAYDAGILYVDDQIGRLLAALAERGLGDDTAIVVTADHGEAFLDHFLFMHQEVYDSLLRVPLLVRPPKSLAVPPRVDDRPVALADVVPTLLGLAGLAAPATITGRKLPLAAQEPVTQPRDFFAYYLFPGKFTYQAFAFRRGRWKLVVHNVEKPDAFRSELYDVADDPGEQRPIDDRPEVESALRRELRRRLQEPFVAQGTHLFPEQLPDLEVIRSLGYIE